MNPTPPNTPAEATEPAAQRPSDRVPTREKFTYAMGGGAEIATNHVIGMMVYQVFSFNLEITAATIGLVLMIFRLWDAFTDPVMGWISDNFRSRWGRRRPFMLLGAVLGAFTFPIFWWAPADLTEIQTALWMAVTGIIFYTSYTIWSIPYQSMLMEMTPDYEERTNVAKWKAIVSNIGGGIVGWFWILALIWKDPVTGEPDTVTGMRWLSIGCGLTFLVLGSLPAFFNKERYYDLAANQKVPLVKGIRQTFGNRPFQMLVAVSLLFIMGTQIVEQLQRFLALYYVYGGEEDSSAWLAGFGSTLWIVTSVGSIPIYTRISKKIGKHRTFAISILMLALASLSKLVLFDPDYPLLMLLQGLLYGPAYSGIWLMIPAIGADIVDDDEIQTGKRREGSFASIFSNIVKLSFALGAFIAGLIVTWSGFEEAAKEIQESHVFPTMLMLAAWVPAIACVIAYLVLRRFPITPETAAETRRVLEERRGAY